jgi:plasmid stabilization system protein ParE
VDFAIRISEAALADFERILAYAWENFPATAARFGDAILNHVEVLKRFPYIGSPVGGWDSVRLLVHTPILIYYRADEASKFIEVLHFWHGSRSPLSP